MARICQDDILIEKYLRKVAQKRKDPEDTYDIYYELKSRIRELATMAYIIRSGESSKMSSRRFLMMVIVHKLMNCKEPGDIFKCSDGIINQINDILTPIYTDKWNNMSIEHARKHHEDKLMGIKRKKKAKPWWNIL